MGPMAGAVVAAPVPGVGDGHAAQVGADANDHEPGRVLHAVRIRLRMPQLGEWGFLFRINLLGSSENEDCGKYKSKNTF